MKLSIDYQHQTFALAKVFSISRGSKSSAEVITLVMTDGNHYGWAEAVPYKRYGESIHSVIQQLTEVEQVLAQPDSEANQIISQLPSGSARNALDCAYWDLQCKQQQQDINQLLGLPHLSQCTTAQTISVGSKTAMQQEAQALKGAPLLKIKLDPDSVLDKVQMIHNLSPQSEIIIDANEGWSFQLLQQVAAPLKAMGVVLIEQPLAANEDHQLEGFDSPIAICADESCHTSADIDTLKARYDVVNIKLDKTGGLTEAIKLLTAAQAADLGIMIGCMVGTSLAMAPAFALGAQADFVDLDGPLLVANDREAGFDFASGQMRCPANLLWGTASVPDELTRLAQSRKKIPE